MLRRLATPFWQIGIRETVLIFGVGLVVRWCRVDQFGLSDWVMLAGFIAGAIFCYVTDQRSARWPLPSLRYGPPPRSAPDSIAEH